MPVPSLPLTNVPTGLASILRAACSFGVEPLPSGLWGLILPDGYDESAGVARRAGFPGPVGPRVGWTVVWALGEGGP